MFKLICSKLIGRDYFKSYSEFYFCLCVARELGRRGMSLDMRDMRIDPDMVTNQFKDYLRWLISKEYIIINASKPETKLPTPEAGVDTEKFVLLDSKGVLTSSGKCIGANGSPINTKYWWSFNFARDIWYDICPEIVDLKQIHYMLVHYVAFWLVKMLLDGEKEKITIVIESMYVKTPFMYTNLYSLQLTLQTLDKVFDLDVDFRDYEVDIEYSIFCNNGMFMGRYNYWSVQEKRNWMKKFGMCPGAIVVIWTRKGVCENNKIGRIESAITARIDEIDVDSKGKSFVAVTTMAINKTREEMLDDYYEIDEDSRYMFVDQIGRAHV